MLELDEAADYPHAGWIELIETLRYGDETSRWRVHGVSRGIRDDYYKFTKSDDWHVHRISAMHRHDWSDAERKAKIEMYGSRNDPDYRRNLIGEHGSATSPLFVLARLMNCVDSSEESDYNTNVYTNIRITDERLKESGVPIDAFIVPPGTHKLFKRTWIGMDVGMCSTSDTEIFTRRGWLRYDEVVIGDWSLAINPDTGNSEWSEITDIYRKVKPSDGRDAWDMVRMEGQSFSAVTTPHHRWLTKHKDNPNWQWKQTRELNGNYQIPVVRQTVGPYVTSESIEYEMVDGFEMTSEKYDGVIWCPTLTHGNWLARRNGSIYFTGNTNHPSEIIVVGGETIPARNVNALKGAERLQREAGSERLRILARIHMERISTVDQLRVMTMLTEFYNPVAFGMDRGGVGLPIFSLAQTGEGGPELASSIRGYDFGSKIAVGFKPPPEDENEWTDPADRAIMGKVIEYSSDVLRLLVDQTKLIIPWDVELIREFQGQSFYIAKSVTNPYGRREFNKGSFHALDACRMFALAYSQEVVEKELNLRPERSEVLLSWLDDTDFVPAGGDVVDPMYDWG
jgi:hypothetical protein